MKRHVHFIGIGGIGVSGVAQLAAGQGDCVSGSDIKETSMTSKLAAMGIKVYLGHRAENVRGADLVVYSSAIAQDNPEMAAARGGGVPLQKRAEFLSGLMKDKLVVTVAGAHGKTTTSSLAAKLLTVCGLDPLVAIGGILREDGCNARFNRSPYFVAEADESDGSFLSYAPTYSIITNIDYEHMDFYRTYDNLLKTFLEFIRGTKKDGCVFYCHEDEALKDIMRSSGRRGVSFGFTPDADFYPADIFLSSGQTEFLCMRQGRCLGKVVLGLRGRHNILNALAVIALGVELAVDFSKISLALSEFKGVRRRFEIKYEDRDMVVVDDYAHHPTEIKATIEAARLCPGRRLLVVFQPHRYSRTKLLLDRFAESFSVCDHLVITDIYPAGEEAIEGIDAPAIVSRLRRELKIPVDYAAKINLLRHIQTIAAGGGLILFLGAGDITRISDEFVVFLCGQSQGI